MDYWRFTSLEFFFVRLRLALSGTAHNNNFLVVDDKRGGGIDLRQSLRPLSTIRNSTFPLIIVRLSLRSYLCSACSISLFTGTCLGCFATVALAKIRCLGLLAVHKPCIPLRFCKKQNLHSISLFTGTCLGCFATVALAKIRNSVFFTILIYVNIP